MIIDKAVGAYVALTTRLDILQSRLNYRGPVSGLQHTIGKIKRYGKVEYILWRYLGR